jgi:hypothetical protein
VSTMTPRAALELLHDRVRNTDLHDDCMEALSVIEQYMNNDEKATDPAPLRAQFGNMPLVPEFGNVHGTRIELALAGGMPQDLSNTCGGLVPRHRGAVLGYIGGMPQDLSNTCGGLVPRHRGAVLGYIGRMVRYAVAIGCHDDNLFNVVELASAAGQKRIADKEKAFNEAHPHAH